VNLIHWLDRLLDTARIDPGTMAWTSGRQRHLSSGLLGSADTAVYRLVIYEVAGRFNISPRRTWCERRDK
jgi:hypothetical protein